MSVVTWTRDPLLHMRLTDSGVPRYSVLRFSTVSLGSKHMGHRTLGRYRLSFLPRTESVSPVPISFSSGSSDMVHPVAALSLNL